MRWHRIQPAEHLEKVVNMWLHLVVLPSRNVLVRASVATTVSYRAITSGDRVDLVIPSSPVLTGAVNEHDALSFATIEIPKRRTVHFCALNVRGKTVHA